jgi:hypothetical protein
MSMFNQVRLIANQLEQPGCGSNVGEHFGRQDIVCLKANGQGG